MLEVATGVVAGHPLLVLRGEIDMANADDLASQLQRVAGHVVVDLDEVGYIDSFGVRALLSAVGNGEDSGRRCVLVCREGTAAELTLRIAGVAPDLVADSRQAAAARFPPVD
jgi:anti-anti-sigma factor